MVLTPVAHGSNGSHGFMPSLEDKIFATQAQKSFAAGLSQGLTAGHSHHAKDDILQHATCQYPHFSGTRA